MDLANIVVSEINHRMQLSQKMMLVLLVALETMSTDAVVCVKRAEIGDREGNLYNCNDPTLTECCERNRTFTCCEPEWHAQLRDQLWVMFAIFVAILMLCLICNCYNRQSEFFRSPTAKEAAKNFGNKVVNTFDSLRGRNRRESITTKPQSLPINSKPPYNTYIAFPSKGETLGYSNNSYVE